MSIESSCDFMIFACNFIKWVTRYVLRDIWLLFWVARKSNFDEWLSSRDLKVF